MVDACAEVARLKEVHAVQVRDVTSSLIGWRAVRAVLLHMHAEEAHVHPVDFLKCKKCFGSVREGLHHFA